jgi:predicted Zn-dependent protease
MVFKKFCTAIGGIALVLTLTGCATNSMTGRSQLVLVSEESASKQSVSYYNSMMGDFKKKEKLIVGSPINARVEAITNKLIQEAVLYQPKSASWNWQVNVIDDDKTINAFCMPGGLMAIYTGLINKLDATDDEIAQVMGHEIGHALAGHGAEKMSVQIASNIAVLAISAAAAKNSRDFSNNQLTLTVAALAFVNLPNGRITETEADKIGIELAARAGYDPAAAVSLWQKMATATKSKGGSDFLSTHPSPERRQETLLALGKPMGPLYAAAKATERPSYDWLKGDYDSRPKIEAGSAQAFYSETWDRFTKGESELKGGNMPAYLIKQGSLADLYKAGSWRDLASKVLDLDFELDLSYFYLSKAARGLGFEQAAEKYQQQAIELSKSEKTACAKKFMVSCSGLQPATP